MFIFQQLMYKILTNHVVRFTLKSHNTQARYSGNGNIEVGMEKNLDVISDLGNIYLPNLGTSHLTIQITLGSLQIESRKPYERDIIKSRIKLKQNLSRTE